MSSNGAPGCAATEIPVTSGRRTTSSTTSPVPSRATASVPAATKATGSTRHRTTPDAGAGRPDGAQRRAAGVHQRQGAWHRAIAREVRGGGLRLLRMQGDGGLDHARLAEAPPRHDERAAGALHWVIAVRRKALDRDDPLGPRQHRDRQHAGTHGLTVDVSGAGATGGHPAAMRLSGRVASTSPGVRGRLRTCRRRARGDRRLLRSRGPAGARHRRARWGRARARPARSP